MANVYVRSGAAGAGTGADWANAYTTLAAAFTAKAAGDSFWVSEDHAETQASAMTNTCPGTLANPCFVYCVDHAGTVPPVAADLRTTATITATGANNLTNAGSFYCYGVTFTDGTGGTGVVMTLLSAAGRQVYVSCGFAFGTSVASTLVLGANADTKIEWYSTTFNCGVSSTLSVRGALFVWKGPNSSISGTPPATMFQVASTASDAYLEGVDLSTVTGTIWGALTGARSVYIKDCKLAVGVTIAATPVGVGGDLSLVRADSTATNYRAEKYSYPGTQTTETTIVRTGGASDGTTTVSWKLVTTANSKWIFPYESFPITIWNDSIAAITTLTIYGTTTGGGVPNNDDIWVEVEYLGSAATPLGSFKTSTKATNLAASVATNNSADTSIWGGGGAGNGFKIVVPSFTPAMAGPLSITVKVAKASTTYYIDPKVSM